MAVELGRYGVWHGPQHWGPELAAGLEQAGYGAFWLGASPEADLRDAEVLLASTNSVAVGTSIVNMWKTPAADVAASYHRLEDEHPGRFLLGVGIGHPERTGEYRSPYETIVELPRRARRRQGPGRPAGAGRARPEGAARRRRPGPPARCRT